MARIDGGELLTRTLARHGVREIFTLHGGHLDAAYQAESARRLRFIDTRHEQAAGHAADGWARTTGRVGVAMVTAGPGVTDRSEERRVGKGGRARGGRGQVQGTKEEQSS